MTGSRRPVRLQAISHGWRRHICAADAWRVLEPDSSRRPGVGLEGSMDHTTEMVRELQQPRGLCRGRAEARQGRLDGEIDHQPVPEARAGRTHPFPLHPAAIAHSHRLHPATSLLTVSASFLGIGRVLGAAYRGEADGTAYGRRAADGSGRRQLLSTTPSAQTSNVRQRSAMMGDRNQRVVPSRNGTTVESKRGGRTYTRCTPCRLARLTKARAGGAQ